MKQCPSRLKAWVKCALQEGHGGQHSLGQYTWVDTPKYEPTGYLRLVEEEDEDPLQEIAYELRTANLIAVYAARELEHRLEHPVWTRELEEIKARLGITKRSQK